MSWKLIPTLGVVTQKSQKDKLLKIDTQNHNSLKPMHSNLVQLEVLQK
jgi:hypothetical protein